MFRDFSGDIQGSLADMCRALWRIYTGLFVDMNLFVDISGALLRIYIGLFCGYVEGSNAPLCTDGKAS